MGASHNFSWRRVVLLASLVAVVTFGPIALPLANQELARYRAEQIRVKYATGLFACSRDNANFPDVLQAHLPAQAIVSIDVVPTFSAPVSLRVAGNNLYYFEQSISPDPPYKLDALRVTSTTMTPLPKNVIDTLSGVENEISYALAQPPTKTIDGTTYFFRTSQGKCGVAVSPKANSRAYLLTTIFYELVELANSKDGPARAVIEQRAMAHMASLKPD